MTFLRENFFSTSLRPSGKRPSYTGTYARRSQLRSSLDVNGYERLNHERVSNTFFLQTLVQAAGFHFSAADNNNLIQTTTSLLVTPPCMLYLFRPGRGAEHCDQPLCLCVCLCVCLSASISLEPLDRSSRNFVSGSPVVVARSSSGGVALRYVLPVIWTTSRLALMGATPARVCTQRRRSITVRARPGQSLMSYLRLWIEWMNLKQSRIP